MKDKLLKLFNAKSEQRTALAAKSKAAVTVEEVRSINGEIETLNSEITELDGMIKEIELEERNSNPEVDPNIAGMPPMVGVNVQRSQQPLNPVATYTQVPQQRAQEVEDKHATLEYRKAFMNFCVSGTISPELRADATTSTGDISAVIPSTILNEVIKKVTSYGQIFSGVRKLNVKGGLTIPVLSLKPTASWIGETTPSSRQKVQANTNISFSYYGLECKVSTSLLSDTVRLDGFENVITDLIVEAMAKSLDLGILSGDGVGKPLGITVDARVPATQKVTLSAVDFVDWAAWKKKVFARMPLSYKGGANFYMASGTFEGYIDGMTDSNGQPIGRINYGISNGPQESFGGKPVVQVEDDIIANYDDAVVGDVVGVYCNLNNYGFNSNMQMLMYRYFDQR